jgi:hypothetical protein
MINSVRQNHLLSQRVGAQYRWQIGQAVFPNLFSRSLAVFDLMDFGVFAWLI